MSTCLRKESIRKECEQSLLRLKRETIDLYQCHWPDPGTPFDETLEALTGLKKEGKIRFYGVSNFTVQQLKVYTHVEIPVANQLKYSLLSREIEAETLLYCHKNRIGVLCCCPMEMGLLTGKYGPEYSFPDNDHRKKRPLFLPEKREQVKKAIDSVRPLADKYGLTPGQLSVAWVLAQPGITTAIVGARNKEQAESNCRAGQVELTAQESGMIRNAFDHLTAITGLQRTIGNDYD
jgi:aryl-alcohol dehydrogenase-like predicted oxidoreductase